MANPLARRTIAPGAQLFREGEPGEEAYIVLSGEIEISALRSGRKVVIATLGEDELFGEMALIDDEVRSATATATVETEVIVIERALLRSKVDTADPLLQALIKVILQRFRWTQALVLQSSDNERRETSLRDQAINRLALEKEIETALETEQFVLFYQPIISLRGGQLAGFEALLRWEHPERGVVSPADFIGLAEETGLIVPIGRWVLKEALKALKKFQSEHAVLYDDDDEREPLFMSVNVSGRQLLEVDEIEELLRIISDAGLRNEDIKLEITESLMVQDPNYAAMAFRRLKREGVRLAIDDFGTGYSSLSYLNRYPLDTLKIDRSFVANMLKDRGSLNIVRGIASLARDLGLDIIAEGIESTAEITKLRSFGCSYGQGYLIAKPLPADEASELMAKRQTW
jgi:EAL domain-containing protein (putative c-di-GMP-specific phosphodiesterase class I)